MLMPGLQEGLREFPGGVAALLEMFTEAGGVELAAAIMGPGPVDTTPGQAIIARIGGIMLSPEDDTVVNASLRLRVAPLLAMLVVGYLTARAAAGKVSNDELAALLIERDHEPGSPDEETV